MMRTGVFLDYSGGFREAVEHIVVLEKAGVNIALVAEAYSFDAVSQLGYLAAKTSTIELGSGVFPIYSRTPSLLAMTAAGLDYVSDGRFQLGIGTSGPQVVEGFHGVPFDAPLGRTREVVDICRQVWRRERVQHQGKSYQIPLGADQGTGLGKPLKIINEPVRERIPILSVLFNNFSMAIELKVMPISTEKYRSTDISGDYAAMARAFGGYGERVTKPEDIVPAIRRGIAKTREGVPVLLEFITSKETEVSRPGT